MNDELISKLVSLKSEHTDVVLVTLVKVTGSAPQEVGAKLIASKDGLLFGTVGGGKVEKKVLAHAQNLLSFGESKSDFVQWNLQTDVGMTCGGVCSFYFEKISHRPTWSVAVFGAGHVAQELVRLLIKLDCNVFCIDPRLDWLEKLPQHSHLTKWHLLEMKSALVNLPSDTFIACMTMGHSFDLPILREAFAMGTFPFVGVIGSAVKAHTLKNELLNLGVDQKFLDHLKCPIGENFGNNTPVEIAISIVAELIISRDKLKNNLLGENRGHR